VSILRKDNEYLSAVLAELKWLDHGFGTRASAVPPAVRTLKQIHSNRVICIEQYKPGLQGDALVSNVPGLLVGVRTADCVPILMADPEHRVAAAVHAGWRGTVSRIVEETVRLLTRKYGTDPSVLKVAIGPSIGACCYEVGDEVALRLNGLSQLRLGPNGKPVVDLQAANLRLAEAAGIPPLQIDIIPVCTRCHPQDFHSYRRDKEASGRMTSYVGICA